MAAGSSGSGARSRLTLADLQAQLVQATRAKLARELDRPLVYAALGASDTVGIGATVPDVGYVDQLAERLRAYYEPRRPVDVHNLGVSGYTLRDIEQWQVPRVPALRPDLVTLWAGGNDVLQSVDPSDFAAQLARTLGVLQRSDAVVFVATVPDLSVLPVVRSLPPWLMPLSDLTGYAHRRSRELGDAVLRLAPAHGAHLVHLAMGEVLADPTLVAADGFHPSDLGYARLADAWWQVIKPFLG